MKDCRDIRWELSAYLDGELTPSQRTEVEAHLASCPDCRQELSEMETLTLGVAALAKLQQAPRFLSEVRRKIAEADQPEPMTWQDYVFRPYWLKVPLEVAALIVIIGFVMRSEYPVPAGKDTRLAMAKEEHVGRSHRSENSPEKAAGAPSVIEQRFDVAKQAVPAEVDSLRQVAQAPRDEPLSSDRGKEAKALVIAGAGDQRQLLDKPAINGAITTSQEENPTVGTRRIPVIHGNEPASPPLAPLSGAATLMQSIVSAQSKLGETVVLHARDLTEARDRTQQLARRCAGRVVAVADSTVFVELPQEYAAAFKLELLKAPEASAVLAKDGRDRKPDSTTTATGGAIGGTGSGSGVLTGTAGTNAFVNGLVPLGLRDEATDGAATTVLEIRVVVPSD